MKAIVKIRITYDNLGGTTIDDIQRTLGRAVNHLVDNGLLSGEMGVCVDDWSHDIYVEGTPEYIGHFKKLELSRMAAARRRADKERS